MGLKGVGFDGGGNIVPGEFLQVSDGGGTVTVSAKGGEIVQSDEFGGASLHGHQVHGFGVVRGIGDAGG